MLRYLVFVLLAAPVVVTAGDLSVSGRVSIHDENRSLDIAFSNEEKAEIRRYYVVQEVGPRKGKGPKKTPPGLAKKGGLPPGLAKRQRLPESVSYEPLPRELEKRLPPLPGDYIRIRVGNDFAILNTKTRVVIDMAVDLSI